jgi:4-hydroxybutyryl-CoA dehydratase/vinylacetyl-CoA-Delta-isomerase
MLLTGDGYRESLRRYAPTVFIDGERVASVADEPKLAPGVNAVALTYDFAHDPRFAERMTAVQATSGKRVNRMAHVDTSADDLLAKLEAVRLVCQYTGCAQRYLTHDAFSALYHATPQIDADASTRYHENFLAYMHRIQDEDLTTGIAMTDAKGDRSKRPHQQGNPDVYVRITARDAHGITIRGTKAIVTGAPYMHELLVMPSRAMTAADADFAVCCAVPIDAPGVTIVSRPAGRPGEASATFSGRFGQATGVVLFDDVKVPWERVFLAGEWAHSSLITTTYATHHRHSCIGARAGFGDLLIGAGALMTQANGLAFETTPHLRDEMVRLITMVEGFYACGVAASTYCTPGANGSVIPDQVFANIGKLLLATQIYEMHRVAHTISGGMIVALPGPDEDHNPETAASLAEVLGGRADIPAAQRLAVGRFIEDITASYSAGWMSVISLHGGGSPEAMKREIYRNYPIAEKTELVERLLDRGVLASAVAGDRANRQPGRCCDTGCLDDATLALAASTAAGG